MWEFITNWYNSLTFIIIIGYAYYVCREYKRKSNTKILYTIPSFSASIGVFFTFLVLYTELKNLKVSADKDVLETLINELSAAFSTSIIGLASSLITNFLIKKYLPIWEEKKQQEKPYLSENPNQLLYDLLQTNKQVLATLVQQPASEQLELLTRIERHTSSIQTHIGTELKYLFEKLNGQFESVITKIGTEALVSTKETVTALNKSFSEETALLLQNNLGAIAEFFENNRKFLEQTASQYTQQGNAIIAGLKSVAEEVNGKMDEVKKNFEHQTDTMAASYQDNANKLDQTFSQIHNSLKDLTDKIQSSIQQVVEDNITVLEKSFERIESYQLTAQSNLEQTTKDFASAVTYYQETTQHQEDILASVTQLSAAYEPIRNKLDELMETWNAYTEAIKGQEHRITDIANTIAQLDDIHQYLKAGNR